MRSSPQGCNLVKYSNKVLLDNDLHVLAAAWNHKAPVNGVNLEETHKMLQEQCKDLIQTSVGKTFHFSLYKTHLS